MDIVFSFIFEVIFFSFGRVVAKIFFPKIGVESLVKRKGQRKWTWNGFTYEKDNARYFYPLALQLLGFIVLVVCIFVVRMIFTD